MYGKNTWVRERASCLGFYGELSTCGAPLESPNDARQLPPARECSSAVGSRRERRIPRLLDADDLNTSQHTRGDAGGVTGVGVSGVGVSRGVGRLSTVGACE